MLQIRLDYLTSSQICKTRFSTVHLLSLPYKLCCFCSVNAFEVVLSIHYFHIDHNACCLPLRILHDHCLQVLLGITVTPREIEDNGYAKCGGGGGVNNMYYGLGENGEFKDFQSDQIKRSSCNIFTAHYARRKADLNLTQVTGTANGFIF